MSCRTSVRALPTQPTILHGLLAQQRRAAACRAEGRLAHPPAAAVPFRHLGGSNARTGRHFLPTQVCPHFVSGHEEDSNPRRLGRRDIRSITGVPDHLPKSRKIHEILQFPDHVKVACPPVKRIVVVQVHVGEPFFKRSTSGLVEEPVPKTVAPSKGVRGANPWCSAILHPRSSIDQSRLLLSGRCECNPRRGYQSPHGAIAAHLVLNQQTPEHYRVRAPLPSLRSSKAEHPVDNRETGERYPAEEPLPMVV